MKKQLHGMRSAKFIGLALLTIMAVFQAAAQTANTYSFATSTATFTPLVGGTATSLVATADDAISAAFPIGFTFVYEGISYTQVMASSNGPLLFGTGRTGTATNNLATATATQRPGVAALWDDQQCTAGVTFQLSGVAPNRVLTVQWLNMEWNWSATVALSYQVKLYETSNVIDFIYRQEAGGNPTGSGGASIGIMGVASANFISLQNSSASPTRSTSASTNNIGVKPATDQVYSFFPTPTSPCSGTPSGGIVALSNLPSCGTGNFDIRGSFPTVLGITYQWQSSPDGITWTDLTNDTLVSLSKPNVSSVTYFRRNTTCTSTTLIGSSNTVIIKPVYGGNAQATVPICGDSLTLSLTNVSAGVNAFQWLESTDNINWTPIFGATLASQKIPSPSINSFYRAVVTCNASASTDSSVSVLVKLATGGTTTVTAANCNDSTTLNVTGATSGAVTYNWLISTDSINWTSMGITTAIAKFPSPTATRFYRRVVTCGLSNDTSIAVRVNEPCQGFGPYSITRNTGVTYTTIQTTGTQFTWASAFTGDDDNTNKVSMPFPFVYQGAVQSAFYVSTNGWLSFDTATVTNNLGNDLNSTNPRRVIAPLWEDLVSLGNNNANKVAYIRYATSGTAPNRVLTVEWAEMERFGYGSPSLNFQVKLYEGSNNIELVYGRMQPFDGSGAGAFDYSLGLTGNNPAAGQKIALLLENSRNFSTSSVNNALSILPSCNTSILFTSGAAFNPSAVSSVPSNDSSSTPVVLNVNALPCTDGCGTYYSSRGATASVTGPAPLSGNPDDDVWFQFVAPISGQVNISLIASSGYDPAFMVMSNLFDTAGLGIAGSRNASTTATESVVASNLTSGNTYLIRVFNAGAGTGSTSGAFSICVNEVIPAPLNDDTAGAFVLTPTRNCTPTAGTTIGSSASPQAVCGGLADDDVWFKFTSSASVDTVTVVGSGTFRPHVQVLTRNMTSLSCQNATVNAGTVKTTLTGLLKDSTYFIRVYHTNAGGATANFTICVTGDSATAPVVATGASSGITNTAANIAGSITANGGWPITASGIVFGTSPLPTRGTAIDSMNIPVITAGSFNKNLAGLTPTTTYYFRPYAENVLGITYGADSSFTTPASAVIPSVLRVAASNLTTTTVTLGGNIISNGGDPVTTSGIVYATTSLPPIGAIGAIGVVDSTTTPLVAAGNYSVNPTGLTHSTKYYYRAYAINSVGTAYSTQDSFTTSPIISTFPYTQNFDGVGNTGWTSAIVGGIANDWAVGAPTKATISAAFSAPNCWTTGLAAQYVNNHNAALVSPQMDLTSISTNAVLRFKHRFITESCCDGGVLEVSIGGGAWTKVQNALGTGGNFNTSAALAWYNLGTQGNSWADNSNLFSSQAGGWITSQVELPGSAAQANVRFRFRFISDVSDVADGWAIDNIEVFEVVAPTVAASSVVATAPSISSANVSWTNGNGAGRIVVARLTSTAAVAPTNMVLYTANTAFGLGNTTGADNFVVFNGTGTNVTVTGLANLTNYTFDVYEYNGSAMHVRFNATPASNSITTPVKFIYFAANNNNGNVNLNWSTASEINNKGFVIERSVNGKEFTYIDFVEGAGNTAKTTKYRAIDAGAFKVSGVSTLYYRLKQVDFDGTIAYSNTVKVNENESASGQVKVYPNPFTKSFDVSIVAEQDAKASILVSDISGKLVATTTVELVKGSNTTTVNGLDALTSGIYFVKVINGASSEVFKVVKY